MPSNGEVVKQEDDKPSIVKVRGDAIMEQHQFIRFKRRPMILERDPYCHYVPLSGDRFNEIAYDLLGGLTRSGAADAYAYVKNTAEDRDEYAHQIRFGITIEEAMLSSELNAGDIEFTQKNRALIWDTKELAWLYGESLENAVWRSPYPRLKGQMADDAEPIPFIMSLAGDDPGLYDDIMQSIAPMIMDKKPDGLIWWVGAGANGKSTLMDALYRLFPGQLASVNVKALEDGRDVPALNRALANIVRESPEGRVEDTERYKCLGTHENFWVHKFHSQEGEEIDGNIHTIYNANAIPAFNDKGHSAKRRTFIIPFNQTFAPDPNFERKTFTPEFFARLIAEMSKYAMRLKKQGYRYKWSAATVGAKEQYDREANTAEEYVREVMKDGLVAFTNYVPVRQDYESWCADNGLVPLGITHLRKAMTNAGFHGIPTRDNGRMSRVYRLSSIGPDDELVQLRLYRFSIFTTTPGLWTLPGFSPATDDIPPPPDPEPIKPEQRSILNNKW